MISREFRRDGFVKLSLFKIANNRCLKSSDSYREEELPRRKLRAGIFRRIGEPLPASGSMAFLGNWRDWRISLVNFLAAARGETRISPVHQLDLKNAFFPSR